MSHFKKYWASVDDDEIMSVLKNKVKSQPDQLNVC